VTVDPVSGKVFVADGGNNRVLRFSDVLALSNGAPAEAVLGQPNFATSSPQTTQDGMNSPAGVAVDSGGHLWVADLYNSRVLRFDHAASKTDGANADGVLGQPDFTSNFGPQDFCLATAALMCFPQGVAVDSSGRLWVADAENHRVLRFDNAASKSDGADADGVLGQPDFTTKDCNCTPGGMCDNWGLTVDAGGHLWVADLEYQRVLRFDNAASKADGADADGVLGQPDFTSAGDHYGSQSGMAHPIDVTVDTNGRLYVAELYNDRVLIFNNAASLPNGANASSELGQPDFTSSGPNNGGLSAASLYQPGGVFFDPAAKVLWVADSLNNRVLMYGQPFLNIRIFPFIGLVNLYLPPGTINTGNNGEIVIRTRGGSTRTFEVLPDVRILPARRAGQLGIGSLVTVFAERDPYTDQWIAVKMVVDSAGAGQSTDTPTPTNTPVGVPTATNTPVGVPPSSP
jgi:DNA-binding beta-propeller fold protein YncE